MIKKKTLNKVDIKAMYLKIIKAMYVKLIALTTYSTRKGESYFSKIRNKTRMPPFATFIQHSTGNPSQGNQMRKRNKIIKIGRKEVKLSLFVDDMILYIEYPKYSMGGKLLGLTKEFSKSARYKINTQIFAGFLCTNHKLPEKKLRKQLHYKE